MDVAWQSSDEFDQMVFGVEFTPIDNHEIALERHHIGHFFLPFGFTCHLSKVASSSA